MIDLRAVAYTGMVLITFIIGGFLYEVARGEDGNPYTLMGAIGGLAYVAVRGAAAPAFVIAVVGAGAIGGLLAAELVALGHEVTLCARRPLSRLVVERSSAPLDVPVTVVTSPERGRDRRLGAGRAQGPGQRGRGALARRAGAGRGRSSSASRTASSIARTSGADVASRAGLHGRRAASRDGGPAPRLRRPPDRARRSHPGGLRRALRRQRAAGRARADDFHTAAWRKLLANLAGNPITALTLRRASILREGGLRELARGAAARGRRGRPRRGRAAARRRAGAHARVLRRAAARHRLLDALRPPRGPSARAPGPDRRGRARRRPPRPRRPAQPRDPRAAGRARWPPDLAALRPRAFAVGYRMLGSVAEAEDIAQETLLRVNALRDAAGRARGLGHDGRHAAGDRPPAAGSRAPRDLRRPVAARAARGRRRRAAPASGPSWPTPSRRRCSSRSSGSRRWSARRSCCARSSTTTTRGSRRCSSAARRAAASSSCGAKRHVEAERTRFDRRPRAGPRAAGALPGRRRGRRPGGAGGAAGAGRRPLRRRWRQGQGGHRAGDRRGRAVARFMAEITRARRALGDFSLELVTRQRPAGTGAARRLAGVWDVLAIDVVDGPHRGRADRPQPRQAAPPVGACHRGAATPSSVHDQRDHSPARAADAEVLDGDPSGTIALLADRAGTLTSNRSFMRAGSAGAPPHLHQPLGRALLRARRRARRAPPGPHRHARAGRPARRARRHDARLRAARRPRRRRAVRLHARHRALGLLPPARPARTAATPTGRRSPRPRSASTTTTSRARCGRRRSRVER